VKISEVAIDNRRRAFQVRAGGRTFTYPFSKARPQPTPRDRVVFATIDRECAKEVFVYRLESGAEGDVHIEEVLEYNRDPGFERKRLLYQLTVEAQDRLARSPLSKREIIRRLRTSPSQLYRILDQTNYRKSIDQVIALLNVLECDVDLVVRRKRSA
jgi:hypothetical protein